MNPASKFFSALFARYPSNADLLLEIRPLLPEWAKATLSRDVIEQTHRSVRRWYLPEGEYLNNAAEYALSLSDEFDVYFGVHPRRGRSGSQDDVLFASCLFADVDGGAEGVPGAIRRIKQSDVDRPDIAIQSGGGVHSYWFLDAPIALCDRESRERFKRTLRRLCMAIGGASPDAHADTAACEVARILRVPGTINHKQQDNPRPVKVLRHVDVPTDVPSLSRSYDWWRSHLPPEPIAPGPKAHSPYVRPGEISPGLERWARAGYPEGKRHHDFVSAAAWLVRDCKLTKEQARDLLTLKAQNSPGRRAITPEEIDGVVKWA